MQPVIDILNLSREEIVRTDTITFAGDTIVGKIAAGITPVSGRVADKSRYIYRVNANGEMLKPINPTTSLYFDALGQQWSQRAAYAYA